MKTYLVQWSIDIEAKSTREAAEKAREIQLDPESVATVFDVYATKSEIVSRFPETIDIDESIEEP